MFIATPARPRVLRTPMGEKSRKYLNSVGRWQDSEPMWRPFHDHWISKGRKQAGYMMGDMPGVESRPVHHTTLARMSGSDEAAQEFGDEWLVSESERWRDAANPNSAISVTTVSRSYVDYVVWRFYKYFQEEPVPGGYFDVSMPEYSTNPYAGAGYVRYDASRSPQMNLMGHRQVAKRIFNIQNDVFPGGGLWWHASEGPRMVYMSYCIGDYDGENGNSIINADNPTYRTMLTPATYRAQYMGSNWGHWNNFLSQGRISVKAIKEYGLDVLWDQWTGLQWLHDAYRGTGWFGQVGHLEGFLAQRDLVPFNKYNMFSPFNKFIGYWEQDITTVDKPEFYASFYIKEPVKQQSHYRLGTFGFYSNYDTGLDGIHQAVLVFYNHGMHEGPVRLNWTGKSLDLTT
jgi:hypothetical protein